MMIATAQAPAVYVYESDMNGFNTKTVFVDDGAEVVAFDAQFTPALADAALAFLRGKTVSPVRYLVVTHPNPDKFNGIEAFKKAGATVVASEATAAAMPGVHAYKKAYFIGARMFTEETYPALGTIDQSFAAARDLTLASGLRVELRTLARPGVSSDQTVAFVPAAGALIVGDLVHHKAHAWLEGGIVAGQPKPDLAGWRADLAEIGARWPGATVYGGRGEAAPVAAAVPAEIAYLETADALVTAYVRGGGDLKDFSALQKTFEARFPGFALGYMIGYGVYGLALAR